MQHAFGSMAILQTLDFAHLECAPGTVLMKRLQLTIIMLSVLTRWRCVLLCSKFTYVTHKWSLPQIVTITICKLTIIVNSDITFHICIALYVEHKALKLKIAI